MSLTFKKSGTGVTSAISSVNSTTSTLTADSVFTGTGEDVTQYASISVSWNADEASADNGLSMQFSTDNSNWDRKIPVSSASDTLQANHGGVHRLAVIARYFRIVYTNGSTDQTFFRLQTVFHSDNSLPLVSRAEQQLNTSGDCAIVRPITDINIDLARKVITGQRAFFFFGSNGDVGTSYEDIYPGGGNINWQTTAAKIKVASSDAADTSAGLGCRSVEVHGLSATGADQDEVIVMNGVTAVESALTYIRVNKMHLETVGTYGGSHQGDIECRVTNATFANGDLLSVMQGVEGAVDSSVQYGFGEANNGFWTVPLGKVLYITEITVDIDAGSNKTADVLLYEREGILDTSAPMDPRRIIWGVQIAVGEVRKTFKSHVKIKQLTDLFFRAKASSTGTKIAVSLDFYLLDRNASGA